MGPTHLAQNKKKNAEVKNETVAFFLFNRFLPARGINKQLQGEENGFCIEMRQSLRNASNFPYEKHRCRIKPTAVSFFTIEFLLLYFRLIPDNKLINELVELFFIR